MTDLALRWIPDDATADLAVAANDLLTAEDLQSAVIISLFSDARAPDDVAVADGDRRGWWGDSFPDVPGDRLGSLLWTVTDRAKLTADTVRRAEQYARDALTWLIDDGAATSIGVTAEVADREQLHIGVEITLSDSAVKRYGFVLGAPTGGPLEAGNNPGEVRGAGGPGPIAADPWVAPARGTPGEVGCGETGGGPVGPGDGDGGDPDPDPETACVAIEDDSAPQELVDIGSAPFHHAVTFDWSLGYRILNVTAEFSGNSDFGALNYSIEIAHANLPTTGQHCGELRFALSSPSNIWLYGDIEFGSEPNTDVPNPVLTVVDVGGTPRAARVRCHVVAGVLEFVPDPDDIVLAFEQTTIYAPIGAGIDNYVDRVGLFSGVASVDWVTAPGGTAIRDLDFEAQSGTITWPADSSGASQSLVLAALSGATAGRTIAVAFTNAINCELQFGPLLYAEIYAP